MIIPTSVRELIASGPLAHLTTINLDGSPQVTVVWVRLEDDEFVCAHMGVWKKVQNMQREPRVALSMLGHGKNAIGLQEYLVVYGQARITEGGTELAKANGVKFLRLENDRAVLAIESGSYDFVAVTNL